MNLARAYLNGPPQTLAVSQAGGLSAATADVRHTSGSGGIATQEDFLNADFQVFFIKSDVENVDGAAPTCLELLSNTPASKMTFFNQLHRSYDTIWNSFNV